MQLEGKVVVITGGSTGIGRSVAELMGERGARLVLAARRADRLAATVDALKAAGRSVIGVPTDIADESEAMALADAAYAEFGRVDVAFLNAGIAGGDNLLDPDLASWKASIDANLYGLLHCIKAFVPRMIAAGERCSVTATTSGAGIHGTAYRSAPYATTKSAQLTVMECLYAQARDAGAPMHVGVVVPPLVRTNLAGDDMSVWEQVEASLQKAGGPSLIEPEDFARVVLDGIEQERFWIEGSMEDDERYFAGRLGSTVERTRKTIAAKARAMSDHEPPDRYLW